MDIILFLLYYGKNMNFTFLELIFWKMSNSSQQFDLTGLLSIYIAFVHLLRYKYLFLPSLFYI